MGSKEKVLLLWVDENKTGIEDVKTIPEDCRFEGCIAPVVWRGDKQAYPAKVLKISDNISELETLEATILMTLPQSSSKRKRETAKPGRGVASDRDVFKALGERAPVPVNLASENTKVKSTSKKLSKANNSAQMAIDKDLLQKPSVQAPISQPAIVGRSKTKSKKPDPVLGNQDATDDGETDDENQFMDADLMKQTEGELPALTGMMTCSCRPCKKMAMFANNPCRDMLSTMLDLLSDETKGTQYLKLQEIEPGVPVVELTKSSGIFLPLATKNQLKVDCKANPKKMIRDTLFALYGQDAFKQCNVTAKGRKGFGINPKVLSATLGFVNRNNVAEDKLTSTEVVTYINKRMGDWRSPRSLRSPPPKSSGGLITPKSSAVPTSTITSSKGDDSDVSVDVENREISARSPMLPVQLISRYSSPTPETRETTAKRASSKVSPVKQSSATAAGMISTLPLSPFKNWPAPPSAIPAQPGNGNYPLRRDPFFYQSQASSGFPYQPYGQMYNNWLTDQQQWSGSVVPSSPGFQYHQMTTVIPPRSTPSAE